jgi:endoglucanase
MADAALAPTFWDSVARRYGSNPLVAFDLFNEPQYLAPYDSTDGAGTKTYSIGYRAQIWHDGGLVRSHLPGNPPYLAAGMQQLYDAVRATGATNLVFVSGTRPQPDGIGSLSPGGYDLRVAANDPLTGTNIVYASHPYYGPNCTTTPSDLGTAAMAVASTAPTMFTEFGTACSNGLLGAQYIQNVISYANSHGIGYVAYQWESYYATSSYGLYASNSGYSPSIIGQPVHDDLLSH